VLWQWRGYNSQSSFLPPCLPYSILFVCSFYCIVLLFPFVFTLSLSYFLSLPFRGMSFPSSVILFFSSAKSFCLKWFETWLVILSIYLQTNTSQYNRSVSLGRFPFICILYYSCSALCLWCFSTYTLIL